MKKFIRRMTIRLLRLIRKWLLLTAGAVFGIVFLLTGPLVINYMFITETIGWKVDLAFSAGEMLQYYGAVLGGVVTCCAIITTMHINNKNRKQDMQKRQFERTYAIYRKLPEILAKLELAAIHVQYSVRLPMDKLMETLDMMKENESLLREQQFANDVYYSKHIESLLNKILSASLKCQENVEHYLQDRIGDGKDLDQHQKALEDAFAELRELINNTKNEIVTEIEQFISVYDEGY